MAVGLCLCQGAVQAEVAWPTVALPKDVTAIDMGERITVNGVPMHMQGFVAGAKPDIVAERMRKAWGDPLVESRLTNKLILGRPQGEYYITVQLEPAGTGTRGLVATTQLKAAFDHRAETQAVDERWLARLPPGSRLLRRMSSEDAGKLASHLLIVNGHSIDLNCDRLRDLMREDGLELQKRVVADDQKASKLSGAAGPRAILYFKGAAKEAIAVVSPSGAGQTAIVLNAVTQMEKLK